MHTALFRLSRRPFSFFLAWNKAALLAFAAVLVATLAACGGNSSSSSTTTSTTSTLTVTVSPGGATVRTSTSQQFAATVLQGSTTPSNTTVTWQVNNVTGGATSTGTITTAGVYTAPATVPNPSTVEIEAISQIDNTTKGIASVTITLPPPTTHIDISPPSATVPAGGQQGFTASINGQAANVTWTLNCSAANTAACGSITSGGVFTAPLSPPPGGVVSLTATDTVVADNTPPANASITVQFSPGTMTGQYAFALIGSNTALAGSMAMNGNGSITGGVGDFNNGGAVTNFTISGGSYTLLTDGRGSIMLNTTAGNFTLNYAAVNHSKAYLTRFDSGTAAMGGTLDLQDSSKFSLASLIGNYAISFTNHAADFAHQVAAAGAFVTDGSGAVSSGKIDANTNGAPVTNQPLTGTILAPSGTTGRGQMTISGGLGGQTFEYYIVDATHLKLVELDATPITIGDVFQQGAALFSTASFNGTFAATLYGFSSVNSGPLGEGATLQFDGSGNIKNANFDLNQNGSVQNNSGVTGTYSLADATTGRTTASISAGGTTLQYVIYPAANGALDILEIDSSHTALGMAFPQQSSAFSNAALAGNFALFAAGTDLGTHAEEDIAGVWLPNGGTTFSGALDVNDNGAISHGSGNSLSGSFLVTAATGRAGGGSMTANNFTTATMNFYVVDANTVLFLEQDSNRALTGIAQKQY